MNAVIAAALISGGWTAAVAVITTRINRKNTSQTIEAGAAQQARNLAADRDARIWDRQADAYQDALKTLLYREKKRHHDFRLHRSDEYGSRHWGFDLRSPGGNPGSTGCSRLAIMRL